MSAPARPSSYHYVVDEPLLLSIAAQIQADHGARCLAGQPLEV